MLDTPFEFRPNQYVAVSPTELDFASYTPTKASEALLCLPIGLKLNPIMTPFAMVRAILPAIRLDESRYNFITHAKAATHIDIFAFDKGYLINSHIIVLRKQSRCNSETIDSFLHIYTC